jgi:hypothetical protein
MWTVIKLSNSALGECYVEATEGDPHDAFRNAANGGVEAIDYWDAEDHKITMRILQTFPDGAAAAEFARRAAAEGGCVLGAQEP